MTVYDTEITFETASLAKEKGFTLRSVGSHVYNYYEDDGRDGYISWGHLHLDNPAKTPQSLLQQWLRTKGIHIEITWVDTLSDIYTYHISSTGNAIRPDSEFYHSYEEALEAGLVEALKLID